jgi:hypothetical protein
MKAQKERRCIDVSMYSFFNLVNRWGGWSTPRPGSFSPGKDPVPLVQEAGWATGPVLTGAENLASTGIRFPERPTSCYTDYYIPTYATYNLLQSCENKMVRHPLTAGCCRVLCLPATKHCTSVQMENSCTE